MKRIGPCFRGGLSSHLFSLARYLLLSPPSVLLPSSSQSHSAISPLLRFQRFSSSFFHSITTTSVSPNFIIFCCACHFSASTSFYFPNTSRCPLSIRVSTQCLYAKETAIRAPNKMAEQCIVCLDTLLHAIEPPPPPLPDDSGSPSTTTSTTTAATTASATTAVLTINTLIPFDSGDSGNNDPPTVGSAPAVPEPSSTARAPSSHDANEVDVKPVLVNGEIPSSDSKSLEDDNVAVIQICGHTLHNTCLKEWTAKANSCPICRQNFNLVEVYDKIGGKSGALEKLYSLCYDVFCSFSFICFAIIVYPILAG